MRRYRPTVQTPGLSLDRVAGPVTVRTGFWSGRSTVTVAGQPVPRGDGGTFHLPTVDGATVPARVRTALFQTYPDLVVDGVRHRTGPATPPWLRILAVLPLLLLIVGGLLGGVVAVAGVLANFALLRREGGNGARAAAMTGVAVGCVITWIVLATIVVALTQ